MNLQQLLLALVMEAAYTEAMTRFSASWGLLDSKRRAAGQALMRPIFAAGWKAAGDWRD